VVCGLDDPDVPDAAGTVVVGVVVLVLPVVLELGGAAAWPGSARLT
jgi:hypothetical protein